MNRDVDHIMQFIDDRRLEEMSIKEPKGLLNMAKQVKLVVGEGNDKVEIGVAEIQPVPNGDSLVEITITNQNVIALLGGDKIQGIIPARIATEQADMSEDKTDG
jgi:hypothetical protein